MSNLKVINNLCPDGVEFKKLCDISKIEKGIQFNKSNMKSEGTYPVINGGVNPSGYFERLI